MIEQLQRAIARRKLIREPDTDALRLVDGASDGFADIEIDDFAGRWLVQTRGDDFPAWLREASQPLSTYWKRLGDKTSPAHVAGGRIDAPFVARENGVSYWIDFNAGYSQGIFLDQRDNRLSLRRRALGKTVLNCFAYTCAFGVSAALGGAKTVNLDLSRRYLEWGKRNYELNGIDPAAHDFIYGDVAEWLRRFQKKARRFDSIVLDPPTFSRNEKGAVFTIESGFGSLVKQAVELLNGEGVLLCTTNQRSLAPDEFRRLIAAVLGPGWRFDAAPMPADFTGEKHLKTWWVKRTDKR